MKTLLLIVSMCVVGAGVVNAANIYSYNKGPGFWDVEGSWTDNASKPHLGPSNGRTPDATDAVYLASGMNITNNAASASVTTGYKANGGFTTSTNGTLTTGGITVGTNIDRLSTIINAGTVTVSGNVNQGRYRAEINNSGTMNIGGNLAFTTIHTATGVMDFTNTGTLDVTGNIGNSPTRAWTFHMQGGMVTAASLYMNASVAAHINLTAGTIDVTALVLNTNTPSIYTNNTIDVTDGVLIADGDNRNEWEFLIDQGVFTAEGGDGGIAARYDSGMDTTTLLQVPFGTVISIN